jgi:hypothetical protein
MFSNTTDSLLSVSAVVHRIMQKRIEGTTITVPVPLHDPVRRGTLLSIIRQSGLARALFEIGE